MKSKKWITIITLIITIVSLAISVVLGKDSDCIIYDISMALFGGASLAFIMSLTEYYVERQRAMEEFWLQATKVLKALRTIKYLDIDAPIKLVIDAIKEEDSNRWKKEFHICDDDEESSSVAKKNLISWIEENTYFSSNNKNIEVEQLYESKMDHYKKVFFQCMDSYRKASLVELENLDNAYGNLDFIFDNKRIRRKAYDLIFNKLRNIVFQFRDEVYHFDLLKDGNGNFPVCSMKISELNQEYFLSKNKDAIEYTNILVFQNVFDDIDSSLEKFRCKIYRIKYVEPDKKPVSGKVIFIKMKNKDTDKDIYR